MVEVIIEADLSGVTDKISSDKMKEVQSKGLEYAAQETVRTLMINSPVDHGLLKSWFIESLSDDEAVIKTPAEYAKYVNDGTGPYVIEPVSAQALYWPGADHPVKRVIHPGIKGQHFVEDSVDEVESRIDEFFLKALEEVLG